MDKLHTLPRIGYRRSNKSRTQR